MKTEVDGDADVRTGVGERAVHRLAIANAYIARRTEQRNGLRQPVRARRLAHGLDVRLGQMRAGHDPEAVGRIAAVQLRHEVEPVRTPVEDRRIPVRGAVLMPRHGTTESRLLDEEHFVERREVIAVDRGRDAQQIRMPVYAEARVGILQGARDHLQHVVRRIIGRGRFDHLRGMPALVALRSADRIGQRPDERKTEHLAVRIQRRAPVAVKSHFRFRGRPIQDAVEIPLKVREFFSSENVFEYIEAAAPIRFQDVFAERSVGVETNGAAIAERPGAVFSRRSIGLHLRFVLAVVRGNRGNGVQGHLARLSENSGIMMGAVLHLRNRAPAIRGPVRAM